MAGLKELSVVIVNYNSAAVIEACLAPLQEVARVIVVDNASVDDSVEKVRLARPDADIILNEENRGYGCAVNQGFAKVKTTYALLINPDAVLTPEAIVNLIDTAEQTNRAGIVAPFLYSPKRGLELELKGPQEKTQSRADIVPEGAFCTWFATGAVWLCNIAAWRDVGGFDENIFLYCEDLDLCRRMTQKDYVILFAPAARGEHLVSQATLPTRRIRWRKEWNIVWSHLYLMKKHEGAKLAMSESWRLLRKHGPKTLFYALVLQPKRFMRDLAVSHAALSFLMGGIPKRGR